MFISLRKRARSHAPSHPAHLSPEFAPPAAALSSLPCHGPRISAAAAAVVAFAALAGCAATDLAPGRSTVAALTSERTGHSLSRPADQNSVGSAAPTTALLANPLSADTAVELALRNNAALAARLAALDIDEAQWKEASRLRNPGLRFGRMQGGQQVEIERSVLFDLVGLLTLPLRQELEGQHFEQAKLAAAMAALALASQTRSAYFNAVAAQQSLALATQFRTAAEAGSELAGEMVRAGNWSQTEQARQQKILDEALGQFARAQQVSSTAREQLLRLLGLADDKGVLQLPARLPALPLAVQDNTEALQLAMDKRLDLMRARHDTLAAASALGLSRRNGLVNVFELGYRNKSSTGAARENGYEVAFELPLFDWGEARVARAQAAYMQAVQLAADTAISARSQVRESHAAYQSSFALARHYQDEVLPRSAAVSAHMLKRYNGMLVSVFDLLADTRARLQASMLANAALRDFWLAETTLVASIHGGTDAAFAGLPTLPVPVPVPVQKPSQKSVEKSMDLPANKPAATGMPAHMRGAMH